MATLMANGGRALSATRGGLARGTGATAVTPGAVAVPRLTGTTGRDGPHARGDRASFDVRVVLDGGDV